MSFKEDALRYISEKAIPLWKENEERRDSYIPRTLVPEGSASESSGLFSHFISTIKDEELVDIQVGAVLGQAGAGKSYVLSKSYKDALDRFVERKGKAPFPAHLDCGSYNLPSSNRIDEALRSGPSGELFERVAEEHPLGIHLFVDEADVRVRKAAPSFAADLRSALRRIDGEVEVLNLTISSRKKEWERLRIIESAVGEIEVCEFPSRPLGSEYSFLIPERRERNRFFGLCRTKGYHDLLSLAFEGFGMAREFAETGGLPETREVLWEKRISMRLAKSDAEVGLAQAPPQSRLRFLARLMACLAAFSERESWSLQEAVDDLGSAPAVGHIQPVTSEEVKWLLGSRLFKHVGEASYDFIHERYRDRLCAEMLSTLKPRKKRLLLQASAVEGRERTVPPLRTVAATLASIDTEFGDDLIRREPEVAIFGSLSKIRDKSRRELVSSVVEWGVQRHVTPWYEVEGTGEQISSALSRHRVNEPESFLKGMLESDSFMRRFWAVVLASQWNGVAGLNDILAEIAEDGDERDAIRGRAIEAIQRSGDASHIQMLKDLTLHENDEVRGCALEAWRELSSPSADEYATVLSDERSDTSHSGKLSHDPSRFAATLGAEGVQDALQAIADQFNSTLDPLSRLNSLQEIFLRALLSRARELEEVSFPVPFIVDYFVRPSMHAHARGEFKELLQARPDVWRQVFNDALGRADELNQPSPAQLTSLLGETIPGSPDEELPEASGLSQPKQRFVGPVRIQAEHRIEEAEVEDTEGEATTLDSLMTDEASIPDSVDEEQVRERLGGVIGECGDASADCAEELLREMWRIQAQVGSDYPVPPYRLETIDPQQLRAVLELADAEIREQVFDVLESAFPDLAESSPGRSVAGFLFAEGTDLPLEPVDKLLRSSGYWADSRFTLEAELLSNLRERDRDRWQEVVLDLVESDPGTGEQVLRHLIETEDGFYLNRAALRLRGADYDRRGEWAALLKYVLQQEPSDLIGVLRTALYTALARRHINQQDTSSSTGQETASHLHEWDIARVLFEIISRSKLGWMLFEELVDAKEMPLTVRRHPEQIQIPEPKSGSQVRALARWYHQIREAADLVGSGSSHLDNSDYHILCAEVMSRIVQCGTEEALRAVKALQWKGTFKKAKRLGGRVLQAENELLKRNTRTRLPRPLLKFLATDHFHLVQSDEDLFEVLREAVEDLQGDFGRARGVAGFWEPVPKNSGNHVKKNNSSPTFTAQPKHEEECQNILWALIRPKLQAYGLADVEEEVVGAKYADLRVEYPTPGRHSPRIFVEVKVARKNYSRVDLVEPLETQLCEEHLLPTGDTYGLYLVVWARDVNRHDYPRGYGSPEDLLKELECRAKEAREKHEKVVAPYVLDVSEPYRQSKR